MAESEAEKSAGRRPRSTAGGKRVHALKEKSADGGPPPSTAPVETTPSKGGRGAAQAQTGGSPPRNAAKDPLLDAAPQAPPPAPPPLKIIRQYELIERVRAYCPGLDEDKLNSAYVFSMRAHGGQTRKSGDPYFTHPLAVAAILADLKADPATVMTALLHDVVEDTDVTVEDIRRQFGDEIAYLVDGVTKLSKMELNSEASKEAENFRKLVVAMAKDMRVLLVKLADRLHNMRTLHFFDNAEKRRRIALETMEIYAPLAGRIGVQKFREELEDLSFRELSPQAHDTITNRLENLNKTIVRSVVELAQTLRVKLDEAGLRAEVHSREKRPYSIWRKMSMKNVSFDDLADIYAFRVIVETVEDCYRVLGVVHTTWRMIQSEFDDYISAPKPNNYRSLHTAVIGPPSEDGGRQRIEIQIRTRQMHESAERGVAAHWQYKDGGADGLSASGGYDPYDTPRRLVEMFQHGEDPDEALRYAKLELFQDQVFCFTPKGRVIALPKGATGIDFAYALHSELGDGCIGVKINGVSRPLRTPLRNGDVVLVLNSDNAPVPPDWESMAVTGRARSALRRRVKKMRRAELVELGRAMAENVFASANLDLTTKAIKNALRKLSLKSVEDVFVMVGRGELSTGDLVEAVYPGASFESEGAIRAAGMTAFRPRLAIDNLPPGAVVTIARCCAPIPGERIVGVRDEDGNVAVHAIDCGALADDDSAQSSWIDLKWRDNREGAMAYAHITATVSNGVGVLSEVAGVIARYGVSIANIRLENRPPDFVDLFIDVTVKDLRQLEQMLAGLRASTHVIQAKRNERPEL